MSQKHSGMEIQKIEIKRHVENGFYTICEKSRVYTGLFTASLNYKLNSNKSTNTERNKYLLILNLEAKNLEKHKLTSF
jgi:hypothetical protein